MSQVLESGPQPSLVERIRRFRPSTVTGGAPVYPLMVLFGLNAVDELDREAFTILLPNIRTHFGLGFQGILTFLALAGIAQIFLEIPIAHYADRGKRTMIAAAGAAVWGIFSLGTGLAPTIWLLGVARVGSGLAKSVSSPTHRGLLSDYYPVEVRPAVFGFWNAANSVGQFVGPLSAGAIAWFFGWRAPFFVFALPTLILVFFAVRMQEPVRGIHERRIMGADRETAETEEAPASFAEAVRILWQVKTLRWIWLGTPLVVAIGLVRTPLLQLFYSDVLGLNEAQRGLIAAVAEPFQILGLLIGIPIATKLMRRDPALLIRLLIVTSLAGTGALVLLVLSRRLVVAIVIQTVLSMFASMLQPGLATVFSLLIPPRVRSLGFTFGSLFAVPALLLAPILGGFADAWSCDGACPDTGLIKAILLMAPISAVGAWIFWHSAGFMVSDIHKVRTSTLAMSEVRAARKRGEVKLLLVKEMDVSYDQVQVLFGVDFEVGEGEIIALLGTNGAGKSTLLKSISGLVAAGSGAVIFDGQDITHSPPNEVARKGVVQVPGGRGVFPSLSVAENLKIAGWLYRRDADHVRDSTQRVLEYFPVLRERWEQPAGNLSGGEQQMLTLGMAFIAKPKLLMIDELSLGLAPVIVEQLLEIVRAIQAQGTTIILVEQSVNVALTVADTAYFMEKGEIRFKGPTSELLNRPDILRSVFLEGAATVTGVDGGDGKPRKQLARAKPRAELALPGTEARAVLEVRGLSKSFGGVRAVSDVTFSLRDGQILGVIGPNGAGKTTIFDLISGFLTVDHGEIVVDGEDMTAFPPEVRARRGLGRSFQDARLFPALTVSETISLALARRIKVKDPIASSLAPFVPAVAESEREISERVEELIELMGLGAFRDKFVSELSTGSRRIVDLACVLAHEPKVLLFDEPSSGIAQRETEALGPLLLRIREATGSSLLVIEHDMPLVTSISDEMLALDLGQVVTQGPPDDVVNHPTVVASYLGTSEDIIARSGALGAGKPQRRRKGRAAALRD